MPNTLLGKNISDTYPRLVQVENGAVSDGTGSILPISFTGNNVTVAGTLTANSYIVSESIIAVTSGSTIFGNSADDSHQFTGSIAVSGSGNILGNVIIGNSINRLHLGLLGNTPALGYSMDVSNYSLAAASTYTALNAGSGKHINFNINNTTKMRMDQQGDLGIGTTNPIHKLDVTGNIRATTDIFCDNNLTVGNNISASGNITVDRVYIEDKFFALDSAGNLGTIANLFAAQITASGNISTGVSSYIQTPELRGHGSATQLHVQGQITASGNISSSGDIISSKFVLNNKTIEGVSLTNAPGIFNIKAGNGGTLDVVGFKAVKTTFQNTSHANITASGNISSSGYIYADHYYSNGGGIAHDNGTTTFYGNTKLTEIDGTNIKLDAPVTASGNISSSGKIIGNSIVGTIGTATQGTVDIHSLSGYVANEHLDWTNNVGTIHAGNYTDTNTTPAGTYSSSLQTLSNVTASGNISSSGTVQARNFEYPTTNNTIVGSSTGDIIKWGTSTATTAGQLYYYNTSGAWTVADADAVSTAKGLLAVATDDNSTKGMLLRGVTTLHTITGTQDEGASLYLKASANGHVNIDAPSTSGHIVRIIGYCLDTSKRIWFDPDKTWVELS